MGGAPICGVASRLRSPYGHDVTEHEMEPMLRARSRTISSQVQVRRVDPKTAWVWAVALLPAVPFVLALALVTSVRGPITVWALPFLIALGVAATVAAAWADRAELVSRGAEETAGPSLAVVPALYLWRRADAFRGSYVANSPFWVHLVVMPVALVTFSVWSNLVIAVN